VRLRTAGRRQMNKFSLIPIPCMALLIAASQALAGSGGNAGFLRSDSPLLTIQNRGNHEIAFTLLRADGTPCGAEIRVPSANISTVKMCNDSEELRMHNGQEFKNFKVSQGKTYEIFWRDTRWDLRDVTNDRNN
jgi:hypothetical protein